MEFKKNSSDTQNALFSWTFDWWMEKTRMFLVTLTVKRMGPVGPTWPVTVKLARKGGHFVNDLDFWKRCMAWPSCSFFLFLLPSSVPASADLIQFLASIFIFLSLVLSDVVDFFLEPFFLGTCLFYFCWKSVPPLRMRLGYNYTMIIMKNFNRRSSHEHHGSNAANWCNTHTHVDRTRSSTHTHTSTQLQPSGVKRQLGYGCYRVWSCVCVCM